MREGRIVERFLDERNASARVECDSVLTPQPGQYLLAYDSRSDEPLAVPVFSAGSAHGGFLAAPPLPWNWIPGTTLQLRGPFGHGFSLPVMARRIALSAWDASPATLFGLIPPAQALGAAISLVCNDPPEDLPADMEIYPLSGLGEVSLWADYLAMTAPIDAIRGWRKRFTHEEQLRLPQVAQVLVIASIPCGGLAKCGVCSIETRRGIELACEDGPVFQLNDLI